MNLEVLLAVLKAAVMAHTTVVLLVSIQADPTAPTKAALRAGQKESLKAASWVVCLVDQMAGV